MRLFFTWTHQNPSKPGFGATESLQNKIINSLITSPLDDKRFLPESSLAGLITIENIQAELRRIELPPRLSRPIFKSARKIFTILVYIDMVHAMESLLQEGFIDECIPIDFVDVGSSNAMESRHRKMRFESFSRKPWKLKKVQEFYDDQWLVQSPVFKERGQHYNLDKRCPLPFIDTAKELKRSHFSHVREAKVHHAHQSIFRPSAKGNETRIALKELASDEMQQLHTEAGILQMIRELNHPHLIQLIASYQRDQDHCLMFPWADGGNLREFWKREDQNPLTAKSILWALQQMRGLADALKKLHNFRSENIRHGDLKPENILLFKELDGHEVDERGILLIADVGLAKRHFEATGDRNAGTQTIFSTQMYEPPEIDVYPDEPRSRKYDLWSMGCIFLEFIIWLLSGSKEVERFKDNRGVFNSSFKESKFYEVTELTQNNEPSAAAINSTVRSWMDAMYDNSRCKGDTAFKDLLMFVDKRLLQIEVSDRADTIQLYEELSRIVRKAESESSYLSNRADGPRSTAPLGPPSPSRNSRVSPQVVRQATLAPPRNTPRGRSLPTAGVGEQEINENANVPSIHITPL